MDSGQPTSESFGRADLSGRQLDGYRILRRLGRGAMAEVYLAEQVSLSRQVAVKVLRSELATDATYVERFVQEARAAARLMHANIVQIYEVGCAGGVHFIAQEYVQGLSLAELLARRGPPDLAKSLAIIRQVAEALAKAAEHSIVHRDIKPENIMLAASGEAKVADFGLARLYGQEGGTSNLTQVGVTMGTPLYMSPEQVEGRQLDARSDIYSLGVTAYQMFAGEPPFRGETPLSIAVQHLKAAPQRLENIRPDLPPAIGRMVHKMLSKDPSERYATPRQLLHELRAVSIELFQDDPGEPFEGWEADTLPGVVEARRDATQRLAAAMRTTAMSARRTSQNWLWALAALASLALGAALAWDWREQPLIKPIAEDIDQVPSHGTAAAQFIYASLTDTEAAWQSVERYFPEDKNYTRRAREQLALFYFQVEGNYPSAMKIFDELAGLNDAEVQSRAFGLAGQVLILQRQNRSTEVAEKMDELMPLREHLSGEMRVLLARFVQNNRRAVNTADRRQWNTWANEVLPNSGKGPGKGGEKGSGKGGERGSGKTAEKMGDKMPAGKVQSKQPVGKSPPTGK